MPSSFQNPAAIKLSAADYAFPLLPHGAVLDLIAAMKFKGVNIGFFEGRSHVQPSSALRRPAAAARKLLSACRDRGLALAELFLTPGRDVEELAPNHPDAAVRRKAREIFDRSLAFAHACEAECFCVLPGIPWKGKRADALRCCIDEMTWRAGRAKEAGVPFSIEPHLGSIVEKPGQVMALIKEVPDLRLSLDYGHFAVQGFGAGEIEPMLSQAIHIHARGARKGKIQVVAAENMIDFRRMTRALLARKYRGWICVEYVWMDKWGCNRVDNVSETVLLRELLLEAAGEKP